MVFKKKQVIENNEILPRVGGMDSSRGSEQLLDNSCFSIQTIQSIREIAGEFLRKFNFAAFEMARVFDDGTAILLYSDPHIARYVVENKIVVTAPVPQFLLTKDFWHLPAADSRYIQVLRDMKECSPVEAISFANHIQRFTGYYDMFCFLSNQDQNTVSNQLMNMKETAEAFSFQIRDKLKTLFDKFNSKRIVLPEEMRPNFKGLSENEAAEKSAQTWFKNDSLRLKLQTLLERNPNVSITARELDCLILLAQGKTAKDVADALSLSNRTVENYVASMRNKLGCKRKSEILDKLLTVLQ